MSSSFGIHLLLDDKAPSSLTDSEFIDIHDRMRLRVRCTLRNSDRTAVMVYKAGLSAPIACLEFGAANALGTVKVSGKDPVPMHDYLPRVSRSSLVRRFVASDGQTYTWSYKTVTDSESEWQCLNSRSYSVATYDVVGRSTATPQAMMSVDEQYIHITGELLVSLTIMRHIQKYNL